MYIRFIVQDSNLDAQMLDGIFTHAKELIDRQSGEFFQYEAQQIQQIFDWFNANLPCPPWTRMLSSGQWTANAISWFCDDAGEPLRKMWDLVALLREYGCYVRMIQSDNPGKIVYRDKYQIVAESK